MTRGQDRHLLFGVQILAVETGRRVVGPVEQGNVGTPGAQQAFRLAGPAQLHLDGYGAWFGGVGVQKLRQQFPGRSAALVARTTHPAGRPRRGGCGARRLRPRRARSGPPAAAPPRPRSR